MANRRYLFIATFLACACVAASPTFAQEVDNPDFWLETLSTQKKRFHYFMSFNGSLVFRQYDAEDKDPYIEPVWYFDHPTIVNELDLDAEGQAELENALSQWHEALIDLFQESIREEGISDSDRGELQDRERKIFIKFRRRLNDALTAEQRIRLKQIQLRFLINHNGFCQFLNRDDVRKELDISELPVKEFQELQEVVGRRIIGKGKELVTQAVDEWLTDFTEEQRERFDREWKSILDRDNALEQLIWQLEYKSKSSEDKPFEDVLDVWGNWPGFGRDVDGNFSVRAMEKSTRAKETQKLHTLQHLFRSRYFTNALEFSDAQIQLVEEKRAEYQDHKYTINGLIGQKYQIPGRLLGQPGKERMVYNFGNHLEVLQEFYQQLDGYSEEYSERLLSILLPHQEAAFDKLVANIRIRAAGPLADLLDGDLGRSLELTDQQRDSIQEKAIVIHKKLARQSREVYERALQELVDKLAETDQRQLRKHLGKPLDHGPVNLYCFGITLMIFAD